MEVRYVVKAEKISGKIAAIWDYYKTVEEHNISFEDFWKEDVADETIIEAFHDPIKIFKQFTIAINKENEQEIKIAKHNAKLLDKAGIILFMPTKAAKK